MAAVWNGNCKMQVVNDITRGVRPCSSRRPAFFTSSRSDAKGELLKLIATDERGLRSQSDQGKLREIVDAFEALARFGDGSVTTDPKLLNATWRMLWTTEKEQLFIVDKASIFKTSAGDILQVINVEQRRLNNVITFPPSGAFVVTSTLEVASEQRVNFKFTSALLRGENWSFPVPPFGEGWFDSVYCDTDLRLVKTFVAIIWSWSELHMNGRDDSKNISLNILLASLSSVLRGGGAAAFLRMAIGVLALQGSFNEHIFALKKLGVNAVEVRNPEQMEGLSGLIIPGGESTTMAKLAEQYNFFPALKEFTSSGKPVWGTCAGLIFLADRAVGQKQGGQGLLGGLDCTVHRNFFGSQVNSFESEISVPELAMSEGGPESFRAVFIRAPGILDCGPSVDALASCDVPAFCSEEETGSGRVVVAVRQGSLLGTAFHPELTSDTRWHSYFVKLVQASSSNFAASTSKTMDANVDVMKNLAIFE